MFKKNILLSQYSNFCIGGKARYFFAAKNTEELKTAFKEAREKKIKIFVLGGGTNILIGDEGFNGLVLKPEINFLETDGNIVSAGAGVLVSELLDFCVSKELGGLEWAGGLPGTVGGAVYGNAGAFGGETKDNIKSVTSLDTKTLSLVKRGNGECDFSYRSSIFKKSGREIIVSAEFALKKGDGKEIKKAIREKINYRRERHPLEYPNIGSIFKNVPVAAMKNTTDMPIKMDPMPVIPSAFLINEAGLKGIGCGGAMISEKHPNFIINFSGATAADVDCLIELVKKEIRKKFQVDIEEEIIRLK